MIVEKMKDSINAFKGKSLNSKIAILLPYCITIFLGSRLAELYRLCNGSLYKMLNNVEYIYKAFPRFTFNDIAFGVATGCIIIWLFKWYNKIYGKNERLGEEYGSARWGTAEDIQPFIDKNPYNNIILSATERLSMKARMPKFNLNRNKHVVVYGGSGSGKTYGFVKPNLYQLHSSYVLTDPNG